MTLGGAGFLLACVLQRASRGAPGGVLVIAATYLVPVLTGQAGPWSAGFVGVGLLALAWLTQADVRRQRRLPTEPLHWSWRSVAALTAATVLLDAAVAVVAGGGSRRYHLSPLSVLVTSVSSAGLVALVALAAVGGRWPARSRNRPL